jgi:micrococcal nuclease
MKTRISFIACLAYMAVLAAAGCYAQSQAAAVPAYPAQITAVVDGDTVKIRFAGAIPLNCKRAETVRLIGVDTPELHKQPPDYYAQEARDFTNKYWKADVVLAFDKASGMRDKYGRLLAYVYVPGESQPLNLLLIGGGLGFYYGYFAFEKDKMQKFSNAEAEAKAARKGMWKP